MKIQYYPCDGMELISRPSCCLFLTYALWWNKPYAPNEPIILRGDWTHKVSAFMYMSSMVSTLDESAHRPSPQAKRPRAFSTSLRFSRKPTALELVALRPAPVTGTSPSCTGQKLFQTTPQPCLELIQEYHATRNDKNFNKPPRIAETLASRPGPCQNTRNRWALASAAIAEYPALAAHSSILIKHEDGKCLHFEKQELVTKFASNYSSDGLVQGSEATLVRMAGWAAAVVYGAVHIAAWNDDFPTEIEAWLWRGASCFLVLTGLLCVAVDYGAQKFPALAGVLEKGRTGRLRWYQSFILSPLGFLGMQLHFWSRIYIIVEVFISLRSLPSDAYATPSWTQFIPHL